MRKTVTAILLALLCLSGKEVSAAVINSINTNEKVVYLTFDDGPDINNNTLSVMNTLLEYDANATFFFTGQGMRNYPEITRQIYDNGFTISHHGYDHQSFAGISAGALRHQIAATNRILDEITGERSLSVRPPYGALNQGAIDTLSSLGLEIYMWNVDPRDWSGRNSAAQILAHIKSNVSPGAVILLHTGHNQNKAAQILPELLDFLAANGYRSEALPDAGYNSFSVSRSTSTVLAAGRERELDMYKIGYSNYVNIRDLARIFVRTKHQYSVTWNEYERAAEIKMGLPYSSPQEAAALRRARAAAVESSLILNGETLSFDAFAINGKHYINLREIADALSVEVSFDAESNLISLN
jgi:peptidoglycan/xylan/chitin deacetylase (PgdA/CDA1 family)